MQYMCYYKLFFWWIDIHLPGYTSDYMAWIATTLCQNLERNKQKNLLPKKKITGGNIYIFWMYLDVTLKVHWIGYKYA